MFIKPEFQSEKTELFSFSSQVAKEKVKVRFNPILSSPDFRNRIILLLFEGMVKSYIPLKKYLIESLTNSKIGYLDFEIFMEMDSNFPTLVCETECLISCYPVQNILSLLKKNANTFIAYFQQLNLRIDHYANLTNKISELFHPNVARDMIPLLKKPQSRKVNEPNIFRGYGTSGKGAD